MSGEIDPMGDLDRMEAPPGGRTAPGAPDPDDPRRCTARSKQSGERCRNWSAQGQKVCRFHGGGSPQAKRSARLRLAELVDPAIATLAKEMVQAETSSDRQKAANSVLDRAGYGRTQRVELEDAQNILLEKLRQLRDGVEDEA